jgi:hypothetical protein
LSFEYGLLFSESVSGLASDDFNLTGSSCEVSAVSGSVTRYTVQVSRCADGVTVGMSLKANSVSDTAMNLGPAGVTFFTTVTVNRGTIAPTGSTPTPTPTSSPTPTPSPTSTTTSAPDQGSSAAAPVSSNSGGTPPPTAAAEPSLNQSEYELVAAQPLRKTYAFTQAIKVPLNPDEKSIAILETDGNQITIDNPTDDPPIQSTNDWQRYAIIGVGALSGLLAAIGFAKLARQLRNKRLVRKFA